MSTLDKLSIIMRFFTLYFIVLLNMGFVKLSISKFISNRTYGIPWPMPYEFTLDNRNFSLAQESFKFYTTYSCDILDNAMQFYRKILFPPSDSIADVTSELLPFTTLKIVVHIPCPPGYPPSNMIENYTLSLWPNGTGLLESLQVWGALRGLETFSQLVIPADPVEHTTAMLRSANINDSPRFPHRGILLDTSRHFVPVDVIKTQLELMAQNKFNVFHWHIVDDPSFPYQSDSFPNLSNKGAFSNQRIYKKIDILKVINYARLWGIRVIAEFDTPCHVQSWADAMENLTSSCDISHLHFNPLTGSLDPTRPETYSFMKTLLQEVFSDFPDEHFHLGGDECDLGCWDYNWAIRTFKKEMNFTTLKEVQGYYLNKLLDLVMEIRPNTTPILWEDGLSDSIKYSDKLIIQMWLGNTRNEQRSRLANVTARGYRTLVSSCWYLNIIKYGIDWPGYYDCDPRDFNGTAEQKSLVLGGEACMWGEHVDSSNLTPRLWPRAAAVGERLWSTEMKRNASTAERLENHRCRLLARGYTVEPVNGPGYCYEVAKLNQFGIRHVMLYAKFEKK
ncbi:Beta-hexosaminidase subunit alpha [Trichinella nelsoni]|uniref:Beta-hexosaminidase n=1 Tax=Trichinella nelsoni TaxID=6336 RepID=A0A0V0SI40_9BILA|nr:Beta-hexosaminidase subunit alpha [Trichinella nelsoni]